MADPRRRDDRRTGWSRHTPGRQRRAGRGTTVAGGQPGVALSWAVFFLIITLLSGVLWLLGLAGVATGLARLIFLVAAGLFLVALLLWRRQLQAPPPAGAAGAPDGDPGTRPHGDPQVGAPQ